MDVEDAVRARDHFDGADHLLPLVKNARRQTGGVGSCPSGDAVLDPDALALSHASENIRSHPPGSGATGPEVSESYLSQSAFRVELRAHPDRVRGMTMLGDIRFAWRAELTDGELASLTRSHGGRAEAGWWARVRPYSLGWVTARLDDGTLVGFVNVAWDGGDHAFLLDTKVRPDHQRRGIGTELVRIASRHAKEAGCEWLEVDFEKTDDLAAFYFRACGFRPTNAGLLHLPDYP